MHKKKISALVVAGLLTVGVIGGTLAWFTSSDSVTNKFTTGTTPDPSNPDSGVKIEENFDEEEAGKVLPGNEVNKQVQVKNTASYDQFIRVKITPKFVSIDKEGNRTEITSVTLNQKEYKLDTNKIVLNFTTNLNNNKTPGSWFKGSDGYYYYMGKVGTEAGKNFTNTLLESVTLSSDAGNEYKNIGFDVKVIAESIQASNDAYKDWCEDALDSDYAKLQSSTVVNPTDAAVKPNN